jgi:hypothetical protein
VAFGDMNRLENVFDDISVEVLFGLEPDVMLRDIVIYFDIWANMHLFWFQSISPDTKCFEHMVFDLIVVDLIFDVRIS